MNRLFDHPVLLESRLEDFPLQNRGKVRDLYDLGETLLIVATDRLSAFDVVLPEGIPDKGTVLTQLSAFWFRFFSAFMDLLPSHFITTEVRKFPAACLRHQTLLEGRSMLVKKATPLPVECIVRGYLAGSAWADYQQSGTIGGQPLPEGIRESQCLPEPLFTPSTKAERGEHDRNISLAEMEALVGPALTKTIREASLKFYRRAAAYAESQGLLIADTKLEFGIDPRTNQPILIDEVLTPDSSRFWPRAGYAPGRPQPSFDKQFVRDYLLSTNWNKQPPAPHLPPDIIRQTSERYREAYRRLTGSERPLGAQGEDRHG